MNALGWLIVLAGPALCAASGAGVAHLFWLRRAERWMDDCWAEAYERGRYDESLRVGTMAAERPTAEITAIYPPRHGGQDGDSPATIAAAATLAIRMEFDRIRARILGPGPIPRPGPEYEAAAGLAVSPIPTE